MTPNTFILWRFHQSISLTHHTKEISQDSSTTAAIQTQKLKRYENQIEVFTKNKSKEKASLLKSCRYLKDFLTEKEWWITSLILVLTYHNVTILKADES